MPGKKKPTAGVAASGPDPDAGPIDDDEAESKDAHPIAPSGAPTPSGAPIASGAHGATFGVSRVSSEDTYNSNQLIDINPVYLIDRSGWADFKRALNECGLAWNLPHWMTTIVYKGTEWIEQGKKGIDLGNYFLDDKIVVGGGEVGTSDLGAKLVAGLGLPKNMGDYIQVGLRFCVLNTVQFESDKKLPARQKLWNWMIRSLKGPRGAAGPYYYLVDDVQPYDISSLFKRLCQVLEQITICSLDDELETVIKMDYKPQKQNIFSYLVDLRRAVKRLHDINDRLPKEAHIWLPDSYVLCVLRVKYQSISPSLMPS